jgi:hypothetical protein
VPDLDWRSPIERLGDSNFRSTITVHERQAAAWIAEHRNRGWPAERGMVDPSQDQHLGAAMAEMFVRAVLGEEAIDPADEIAKAETMTGDGGHDIKFRGFTVDVKYNNTKSPWLYMNADQRRRCTADILVLVWTPRMGVVQTGGQAWAEEVRNGHKPPWGQRGDERGLRHLELRSVGALFVSEERTQ